MIYFPRNSNQEDLLLPLLYLPTTIFSLSFRIDLPRVPFSEVVSAIEKINGFQDHYLVYSTGCITDAEIMDAVLITE